VLIGFILAVTTIVVHQSLDGTKGLELTSFLMIMIGAVYFGFALMSHHKQAAAIEIVVAILFVLIGIFGLWFSPWLLVAGLFLHGVWDLVHHNNTYLVEIPKWYIPFCATYDMTMALYIGYTLLY